MTRTAEQSHEETMREQVQQTWRMSPAAKTRVGARLAAATAAGLSATAAAAIAAEGAAVPSALARTGGVVVGLKGVVIKTLAALTLLGGAGAVYRWTTANAVEAPTHDQPDQQPEAPSREIRVTAPPEGALAVPAPVALPQTDETERPLSASHRRRLNVSARNSTPAEANREEVEPDLVGGPSQVHQEAEQLAQVQRVLTQPGARSSAEAVVLLSRYRQQHPSGVLLQEAEALRALAECQQGDTAHTAAAQSLARRFLAAHPGSVMAERIRRACGI